MTGIRLTRRGEFVKLWLEVAGVLAFMIGMPLLLIAVAP